MAHVVSDQIFFPPFNLIKSIFKITDELKMMSDGRNCCRELHDRTFLQKIILRGDVFPQDPHHHINIYKYNNDVHLVHTSKSKNNIDPVTISDDPTLTYPIPRTKPSSQVQGHIIPWFNLTPEAELGLLKEIQASGSPTGVYEKVDVIQSLIRKN